MIELPYEKPEDFQKFWLETTAEAMEFPLKVSNFRVLQNLPSTHEVETFSFAGVSGKVRHGWLAYPEGARSLPGFLWVPPYGRESKLPDEYGTRTGMVSLSFNFHGEDAFHQEAYKPERGYFAEGAEDPESWIFRSNKLTRSSSATTSVLPSGKKANEVAPHANSVSSLCCAVLQTFT